MLEGISRKRYDIYGGYCVPFSRIDPSLAGILVWCTFWKSSFHLCFNLKTYPERGGRELSIAHKIRAQTCREGSHTSLQVSGNEVKVVDHMGRPLAIPGILVWYKFWKKSSHLFFNLKTDPERGGRELSIAHKIRAETCREGSHTPLQVSGNEVKVVDHMGRPLAIPGILVWCKFWKKVFICFSIWKQILKEEVQSYRLRIKLGSRLVGKVVTHPFDVLRRGWRVVDLTWILPKIRHRYFCLNNFFDNFFLIFFQSETRSWKRRSSAVVCAPR